VARVAKAGYSVHRQQQKQRLAAWQKHMHGEGPWTEALDEARQRPTWRTAGGTAREAPGSRRAPPGSTSPADVAHAPEGQPWKPLCGTHAAERGIETERPGKLYKVVRMYQDRDKRSRTMKRGLTLQQAQAHCQDPETSSRTATSRTATRHTAKHGPWFD